jgi:hypothetical protein
MNKIRATFWASLKTNNFFYKLFLLSLPWFVIPSYGKMIIPLGYLFFLLMIFYEFIVYKKISIGSDYKVPVRKLLILFWIYCFISSIVSYLKLYSVGLDILHLTNEDVNYYSIASQRLAQIALVFTAFEYMRSKKNTAVDTMIWWLLGMVISFSYHLYTYTLSSHEMFQRGGTFLEGNFAGLYYLLSFFIALQLFNFRANVFAFLTIAFSLLGIILTKSTAGMLALSFGLLFREIIRPVKAIKKLKRVLVFFSLIGAFIILLNYTLLDRSISEKLFGHESNELTFSRVDRLASIKLALDFFKQSYLTGNGLQSYGFLIADKSIEIQLPLYDFSFRRITNNIYAEILCDLGIIGMTLFGLIMIKLYRLIRINAGYNFTAALLSMYIYWLAFPTYAILYIWCFMGLALSPGLSESKDSS